MFDRLKKEWDKLFYIKLLIHLFLPTAILQYLISLPIIIINSATIQHIGNIDIISFLFAAVGLSLIIHGNLRLYRRLRIYKMTNTHMSEKQIVNNEIYVGEIVFWISIFGLCVTMPYGIIGIISPAMLIATIYFAPKRYKSLKFIAFGSHYND